MSASGSQGNAPHEGTLALRIGYRSLLSIEGPSNPHPMGPVFSQALGDRLSPDPGSLSPDCWQEKSGPASVLVTGRLSQEEALVSGWGFIIVPVL